MSVSATSASVPREDRVRSLADFYATAMRTAVQEQFQYRTANYFYMLGMIAEPVIYLVVWSTIAEQSGGSVDGFTPGYFAAYYIVWTLVRNMNIVFGAPYWEQRIREGDLNRDLLRPIFPLHYDIAYFAGWKVVVIVLWIPLAVVLSLLFDPALHPDAAAGRRLRRRHLGRLPDPHDVPGNPGHALLLDDPRALRSSTCG